MNFELLVIDFPISFTYPNHMGFLKKAFDFVRRPTHSRTIGLAIILILVVAVSLTVVASQQQQQLKQKAATEYSCTYNIYNDSEPDCKGVITFTKIYTSTNDDTISCTTSNSSTSCTLVGAPVSTDNPNTTPSPDQTSTTANCGNRTCSSDETCTGVYNDSSIAFCFAKGTAGKGFYCGTPSKSPNNDVCSSGYCDLSLHCVDSIVPAQTLIPQASCAVCNADINKDGIVNSIDLSRVSGCLNQPATQCPDADINKDGKIDEKDLNCIQQTDIYLKQCSTGLTQAPTQISYPPSPPAQNPLKSTAKTYTISGTVYLGSVPFNPAANNAAMLVSVLKENGTVDNAIAVVESNGKYTLNNIPAGKYSLFFRMPNGFQTVQFGGNVIGITVDSDKVVDLFLKKTPAASNILVAPTKTPTEINQEKIFYTLFIQCYGKSIIKNPECKPANFYQGDNIINALDLNEFLRTISK